jgi:hypothetical protein
MSIDTATDKEIWSAQDAYFKRIDNMKTEPHLARPIGKAINKQVAGNHYKKFAIQPVEFCHKNNIPYLEATAIKYLCRWRDKNGIEDLDKAIHFIEMLKEFENANNN